MEKLYLFCIVTLGLLFTLGLGLGIATYMVSEPYVPTVYQKVKNLPQ